MLASFSRFATSSLALVSLFAQGCAYRQLSDRDYAEGFGPLRAEIDSAIPSDDATTPNITSGHEAGVYWADGRAIVRAPAEKVCAALRRPEVVVNDRSVDSWREAPLEQEESRPGVTGFLLRNTVTRASVTIAFDIAWRIAENKDHEGCAARWSLARAPVILRTNQGWVAVTPLDDALSLVELQAELDAPRVDASVPHRYLELLTEKLTAASLE